MKFIYGMASSNKRNPSAVAEPSNSVACPICDKTFDKHLIEEHVNKCLFLNNSESSSFKRNSSHMQSVSPGEKRAKVDSNRPIETQSTTLITTKKEPVTSVSSTSEKATPLAERMRPASLDDIVGQALAFGSGSMLRSMLEQKRVPNMILWGPPGCGKTSIANVVANICKEQNNKMRFVKLSATMAGISDVKEVVKVAKNEAQFKRHTVLFMDEIHRFNKLQQDTFLPHVENGTITLIGATTENPSFSLNNALLSRCRVVVLEKLSVDEVMLILRRSLEKSNEAVIVDVDGPGKMPTDNQPKYIVEAGSLRWLAEVCDGDARVALGALELALAARAPPAPTAPPALIALNDIQDGIKRSHMVYDKRGDEHYNIVSAVHKSIRASDDSAALYWSTRALLAGEEPLYLARRLVRAAAEDIGLADPSALVEAVACLQGCQALGLPECDVLVAQCAVRLARAPKSQEVYHAMNRAKKLITEAKGPLPPVPLHLRNAPTKMMKEMGYGKGYNMSHKDESGLTYMPEGMENVDLFENL